jgi:hypothetical protein
MPKLSSLQILERIEERLRDLEAGKELEAREINVLLTTQQRQQLKADWRAQQKLRKLKRPISFTAYEAKHKNAVAWIYKCHKLASKTRAERVKLLTAQTKCVEALTQAHATADKLVKSKPNNAVWFDRDLDRTLCVDELSKTELVTNNWLLLLTYVQLPIVVTSRNADKLLTVEERFDWKTIREVRIECYKQALKLASDNILEDLEKEQYKQQVRADKIFLDAYFGAKQGQDAFSQGNIALMRNGIRKINARGHYVDIKTRDKESWQLEAELKKRFEMEMSEEEREQLELVREYEMEMDKRLKKRKT